MTVVPMSLAEKQAAFGRFRWAYDPQPTNPEHIRITDGWDAHNLVRVVIPQLTDAHGDRGRLVVLHAKSAQAFLDFFRDVADVGFLPNVHHFDGSWAPRFVRQTGTVLERERKCRDLIAAGDPDAHLSNHTFGTAIDLNAAEWPLGSTCPPTAAWYGVREIAHRHGLFWGGDFHRSDPMHIEVGRTVP